MKNLRIFFSLGLFAILLAFSNCTPKSQNADQLGKISFAVSGQEEALDEFEKGLLLLHSFEYVDAREAFQAAQKVDPHFAMAHWGEAMTHNHGLWRQQNFEKGTAALEKINTIPAERMEALSELERDFIQGANILFDTEGSKIERDQAYARYMEKLYKKYPSNHEVAAFYAISLLGSVAVGRDDATYEKSAVIAKSILEENPNHPGALHYLIHSYDDPKHAYLAVDAADSYSEVAPDAAHALHMPSHIYVALGMWDEVVASNIASYDASLKRKERKSLDNDARSYHALAWLMYGYLQKGLTDKAAKIMEDMTSYAEELPSGRARAYLIGMTGTFLTETNDWDHDLANFGIKREDLNISTQGVFSFIKGMQAFAQKNPDALLQVIKELETDRTIASQSLTDEGISMCGGSSRNIPNQLDVDQALVMEMELRAMLANLQGDVNKTEEWLQSAASLEGSINYSYGPPKIVKPAHELYAEWLLEQSRPEEAQKQYAYALQRGPKRILSLHGQGKTFQLLGLISQADSIQQLIDEIQTIDTKGSVSLLE